MDPPFPAYDRCGIFSAGPHWHPRMMRVLARTSAGARISLVPPESCESAIATREQCQFQGERPFSRLLSERTAAVRDRNTYPASRDVVRCLPIRCRDYESWSRPVGRYALLRLSHLAVRMVASYASRGTEISSTDFLRATDDMSQPPRQEVRPPWAAVHAVLGTSYMKHRKS